VETRRPELFTNCHAKERAGACSSAFWYNRSQPYNYLCAKSGQERRLKGKAATSKEKGGKRGEQHIKITPSGKIKLEGGRDRSYFYTKRAKGKLPFPIDGGG